MSDCTEGRVHAKKRKNRVEKSRERERESEELRLDESTCKSSKVVVVLQHGERCVCKRQTNLPSGKRFK